MHPNNLINKTNSLIFKGGGNPANAHSPLVL